MAIYDFSNEVKEEFSKEACGVDGLPIPSAAPKKGYLFSALAARLFFLLLLTVDLIWMTYTMVAFTLFSFVIMCSGGKLERVRQWHSHKWISLRRSLVCAVALVVALFSPSFGVMVACTYFLMYDKAGIEAVVPSSLQSEFKEMLPKT